MAKIEKCVAGGVDEALMADLAALESLVDAGMDADAVEAAMELAPGPRGGPCAAQAGARLALLAVSHGMVDTAMELCAKGLCGSVGIAEMLASVGECEDLDSIEFLAGYAEPWQLRACAVAAPAGSRARALALVLADDRDVLRWEAATALGLSKAWMMRPRLHYEQACSRLGAPIWSSSCAAPVDALIEGWGGAWQGQWLEVGHWGLGIASEALGWSGREMAFWKAEMKRRPSMPWREADLDGMEGSRAVVEKLLPKASEAIAAARSGRMEALEAVAKEFEAARGSRWLPLVLAWGGGQRFVPRDAGCLGALVERAWIDEVNAGMVAAAWHQGGGSVAAAFDACCKAGRCAPAALEIISARAADLAGEPKVWGRMAKGSDGARLDQYRLGMPRPKA